jgi:chromate transporter
MPAPAIRAASTGRLDESSQRSPSDRSVTPDVRNPERAAAPTLQELTMASLRIGLLGFGGPVGQIALMQRIYVDERRWIDEPRFLHALNYCMLLPGPEAQQLATYVGWLLHGVRGGLIAGTLFVLPGALVVLALTSLYLAHAALPLVAALFFGIKAAVAALVAEAGIRLAKRALTGAGDVAIALAAWLGLALLHLPFPVVIVAAAAIGALRGDRGQAPTKDSATSIATPPRGSAWRAALVMASAWWLPVALLGWQDPNGVLARVGLLFSEMAMVSFGGAYALLAYLQQQAVDVHGWLSTGNMIDGLGLAETTPGPLVLVNQFVGQVAGWNGSQGRWAIAFAGAALATWCTFLPSFVWIFAGAAHAERLRHNPRARTALVAIRAAVLGVIAHLALWFASHVLFRAQLSLAGPRGQPIELPDPASLDAVALAIALAAGLALWRRVNVALVVVLAALAGTLLRGAG